MRNAHGKPYGAEVGGEGGDVKAEGRLMDNAELKRLCEVQMREHSGHTMNKTTGLCYNETCNIARATLALLDKPEACEKNDARWRALMEIMDDDDDEDASRFGRWVADAKPIMLIEQIDAWIARKGKEAKP